MQHRPHKVVQRHKSVSPVHLAKTTTASPVQCKDGGVADLLFRNQKIIAMRLKKRRINEVLEEF